MLYTFLTTSIAYPVEWHVVVGQPASTSSTSSTSTTTTAPDTDGDGVADDVDNCPSHANGATLGNCMLSYNTYLVMEGVECTSDDDCSGSFTCMMSQDDTTPPTANGIGDVCECEGDYDCDGRVWPSDTSIYMSEYPDMTCNLGDPCAADHDCDGRVLSNDNSPIVGEYNRVDCPTNRECTWFCGNDW